MPADTYSVTITRTGFLKRNLPVILAFAVPVIFYIILFIINNVHPFGSNMYLPNDSCEQYYPFLTAFQRAVQNGEGLDYMWNMGLGSNFASTYAYYLASPTNWIIALLPASATIDAMHFSLVIKSGLMGAAFCYFLIKKFNRRTYLATIISFFYALSSYVLAYGYHIIWLDCLVLLPLIMLGLERLVKEKKPVLYTITLSLAVLSNYYIGIIICIFLCIYFVYVIIAEGYFHSASHSAASDIVRATARFAWFSVIAGLISMAVVMPAIFAISGSTSEVLSFTEAVADTMKTDTVGTFFESLRFYDSFFSVLARGSILSEPVTLINVLPNLYCTVAAFLFVPLFVVNKKISIKKRIIITAVIAFFILSFNFNLLDYLWHLFHFPKCFPCRQSFILIALVLLVSYEVLLNIRAYSKKTILIVAGMGIGANLLFHLLYNSLGFSFMMFMVNAIFIIIYSVVILLFNSGKEEKMQFITILFSIFCIADICFNYYAFSDEVTAYLNPPVNEIQELLESTGDESFYRTAKGDSSSSTIGTNGGLLYDFKSASCFNSYASGPVSDLYKKVGMGSAVNTYSLCGDTALMSMLLGIKYKISSDKSDDCLLNALSETYCSNDETFLYLYQNNYSLSLGYTVLQNAQNIVLPEDDVFEAQNILTSSLSGVEGLFTKKYSAAESPAVYKADSSGRYYASISPTGTYISVTVTVTRDGETVYNNTCILDNRNIIDIHDIQKGDEIKIESDVMGFAVTIAKMNYDKLDDIYKTLSKNQLDITDYGSGYVKGTVNISDGMELMTTIPYEKGWSVYIDGKPASYTESSRASTSSGTFSSLEGAFVTVQTEPGTHEIEFIFEVPGRTAGLIIGIAGLMLFIVSVLLYSRRLCSELWLIFDKNCGLCYKFRIF